jgi:dolichol-phosphate mannosyltransferase
MNNKVVVVPTFNEIENIGAIVDAVMALSGGYDLLVVDDNSPDGTAEAVRQKQSEYSEERVRLEVRMKKSGLGTAYLHGFKKALELGYDYIFEMDADFSHNPQDLPKLYAACADEGYDLAIGSRYVVGVNVVNWPMMRVLMSYFAGVYVRLITGLPVQDTTAGFKCYRAEVLREIKLDKVRFVGYAFQIEMKFRTWKYGFKLKEVPIIFTDRTKGQSKMSNTIFREAVIGVMEMKLRSLLTKYK